MEQSPSIEKELMLYLLEHPDAKDTAEGIMQWWLPRAFSGIGVNELTGELEALVRRGWLTASMHAGTRVYGLHRRRRDEILEGREK